jgi:hypothetical protein
MPKPLSKPRKKFIKSVEAALKHQLTAEEVKAVRRFDDFVVETAVNDLGPEQLVAMLNDVSGVHSPVRLLEGLADSPHSLEEAREQLINFYNGKARACLEAFDFDSAFEQFSHWFLELLHAHPGKHGYSIHD